MLTLFAWLGLARALAPSANGDFIGIEPVRVLRFDESEQAALRSGRSWSTFASGEGRGWTATFDEKTGTVHRAWGPGIPLDTSSATAMVLSVRAFFDRNRELLGGVDPADLAVRNVAQSNDRWLISLARVVRPGGAQGPATGFEALANEPGVHPIRGRLPNDPPTVATWNAHDGGIPVWRGTVELRVVHGNLVMLGIATNPDASGTSLEPQVSGPAAAQIAIAEGPVPLADHAVWGGELVILPVERGGALVYRLAWEIRTRTVSPPGLWVSFVGAESGELLSVHNEVRFVDGTILARHDNRTVWPEEDLVVSPLAHVDVVGDTTVQTDASGAFSVEGKTVVTILEGDWTSVRNQNGEEGMLAVLEGENTWTLGDATQAEIDTYVFLNAIHEWAVTSSVDAMDNRSIRSNVNLPDVCNAYFDGDVNFYRQSARCNNAARVQDVNHHEWGHGFHYYNLEAGVWDGSIGEAVGDIVAFLQTHDSDIGPYFYTDPPGPIREVSTDKSYPEDWIGEVHYNGLIFGGAMWDLWMLLEERLGADDAYVVMVDLFVEGMKGGPDIPGSFAEFLVADDDDGDLGNGTPHQCEITEAFARHGLTNNAFATALQLTAEPIAPVQSPTLASYPTTASVESRLADCGVPPFDHVWTHYSVDGGESWSTVSMTIADSTATGEIPGQANGTVVLYYFEGSDGSGGAGTVPNGGEITPYSFVVGELTELYCEDFEEDDGGYTHELLDGVEEKLADDWQWGEPLGSGGDPTAAFSGDNVWGNDIGGPNQNGLYQADKTNRLTSIPIDVQGWSNVVVTFQRWLHVEDGFYDQANFYVDDVRVWTNHESDASGGENTQDDRWMIQNTVVATSGDALELGWEIESDGGLELGGWTIDDVCVYGLAPTSVDTGGPSGDDDTGTPWEFDDENQGVCACAGARGPSSWLSLLALAAIVRRRRR